MSNKALAVLIFFAYLVGIAVGVWIMVDEKPKEISYSQLEKDLDKAHCEARIIEAILTERIRLTGKPNPEGKLDAPIN